MWPNTKRLNIRSKSREFEGISETIKTDRGEYDNPNTRNNNLTINLREMTFIDQNVLANKNLRPNKVVCKGKQSFQNLSHRFSHLDHLNHENIKLKNQVDELKKKVEGQQEEIMRLRKLQEDDLEAKLPTQCFTGDDSKALKFLIGKFRENFEKVKKSTQALPKTKEPLQGYKNLIEVLDRWSKEVIKADLNTKASYTMSTEEDQLLSSSRSKDTVDFERIPIEKIKFTGNLGVGSSSSVHKAIYEGEEVAVKKIFRGGEQGRELEKMFWKETSIMRKIRHPKIILFMGIAQTEDYYYIITEYMVKRSLDLVLKDQSVYLDTRIRLRIAIDIAKGLNFLHTLNPPVLHRDLKTANCLCNDHLEVKLADFGLAKLRDQNFSTNTIATVRYMAPEFIAKQVFGIKSDIFSFGMILWEIFSRKEPFEELNPTQALYAIAVGKRPEIPKDMPDELKDVVIRCWDQDPNMRPDCSQILQRLTEIKDKFMY